MPKYEKNINHIRLVQNLMHRCVITLMRRQIAHDASKLEEPEKSAYDGLDQKLTRVEYGTFEYRQIVKEHLGPALRHHYENNDHHPEFHGEAGVSGMTLFSLLEMLCDVKAVCTEKGKATDLEVTLDIHKVDGQLRQVLLNTMALIDRYV